MNYQLILAMQRSTLSRCEKKLFLYIDEYIEYCSDPCESPHNKSTSSSSTASSAVSHEYSINSPVNLDQSICDDRQSNASSQFEFDENRNMSSIIDTIYETNKSTCETDTLN